MFPVTGTTPATTASQLALLDVTKRYGDRTVLDRVSLTVRPGEKVGVVGDNGAGKSTLLRLVASRELPDNGSLTVTAPGGIGYLAQTLDLPGTALVGDAIDLALRDVRELERALRTTEDMEVYGDLLAAFEARGGYEADRLVDTALHHLGEREALDRARPLGTLSGGQRSRLALAATLVSSPELLLLDEPTNDLDDAAVDWLEGRLRAHRGTVVAVTHDRAFLERVTGTVLEVDADLRTVHRHGNGYAGYLAAKAAARARWARQHEEWKKELARQSALASTHATHLHAIPRKVPRGFSGAGAFRARSRAHGAMGRIRNAQERLQRLTANPVPPPPEPLAFTGRIEGQLASTNVELSDVRVRGRLAIDALTVGPGARLLVTGPNGAGKSTLLELLAGGVDPDSGTVVRPGRVGILRQNTPYAVTRDQRTVRAAQGEERAQLLVRYGLFRESDLDTPTSALSTGQRRKLELAALLDGPYDLLLLDEPTNHLSPALVEELEAALASFPGTLVVATHDRRLRAGFAGGERLELDPYRS
ncbi:ABC-F family ATP-binding cassette domain-containing protein [Streptomyces finlayi]|uniref:ABC-F family ATP-binding cassette domain-containing protein n=1 Tax=Streptomyces finlayi TaxID=67296 RepID=UPI001E621E01|nr:ABC-F family ATP-binding cassette domain-containing protein [Streptomyces finlayi]